MRLRYGGALATAGLGLAAALTCAPAAPADPPPPDPVPSGPGATVPYVPPRSGIGSVLAQSDAAGSGPLGLPNLSAYAPGLLLAQNSVPSAPGAQISVVVPDLRSFDTGYLVPQNVTPAAPGQGVAAAGIGPTQEDPGTGRLAFLRRIHVMYQNGDLSGALLGQVSDEQLGQPLPGTAPAPGIDIPAGLGPDLTDPGAPQPVG